MRNEIEGTFTIMTKLRCLSKSEQARELFDLLKLSMHHAKIHNFYSHYLESYRIAISVEIPTL